MSTGRNGAEMTTEEQEERLLRRGRVWMSAAMVPILGVAFALGWCLMDALKLALR